MTKESGEERRYEAGNLMMLSRSPGAILPGHDERVAAPPWWHGVWPAALLLLAAFIFVNGPIVGHGFIKDDFGGSRTAG